MMEQNRGAIRRQGNNRGPQTRPRGRGRVSGSQTITSVNPGDQYLDLQEPSFAWPTSYENDEYPTSNRQVNRHQEPTTHESYQSWSEDDSTLVNSVVGRNSREYGNQGRFETYNDPSGRNSYRDSYQQSDRRTCQYDDHKRESTARTHQYDDHDRESIASRNSGHSYASRGQKQARMPFKIIPPKEPNPLSMQSQETPHGALIDISLDPVIMQALKQLELSDRDREVVRKHGQKGKEISLATNFIKLQIEPNRGMYEYFVAFQPQVDSRDIRFSLLREMEHLLGTARSFDGTTLYLPFQLEQEVVTFDTKHPTSGEDQRIFVNFRKQRRMEECIHFYNVLLYRIMNELKLVRLGREYFDPNSAHLIPQYKLEIWPGYVTSIDEFEGGIMLNCDSSSRVLRSETVLEFITKMPHKSPAEYETAVKNALYGITVLTRYNNRMYRVDEIDFNQSPLNTFTTNDGRQISFVDYYRSQYGIEVTKMDQPLLLSRIRARFLRANEAERIVVLVPEICYLTGMSSSMREDYRMMKSLATYLQITPNQRHFALRRYIEEVNKNKNATKLLRDWGLKIDDDTVKLHARVLQGEEVYLGGDAKWQSSPNVDWTNTVTKNHMFQAVDLLDWAVVSIKNHRRYMDDFVNTILRIAPPMGMRIKEPTRVSLDNDRTSTYVRALQNIIEPNLQLVVVIVPNPPRAELYTAIKKVCCVQIPIPSQVINHKTLSKPEKLRSIVQKIALQINCKIGGSLWSIPVPFKSIMVIGIDSYHEAISKNRSVSGFVCSMDRNLTQYYTRAFLQGPVQELMDNIAEACHCGLKEFRKMNGTYPQRIIVYRDGVGDGQLKTVLAHEVVQFQQAFQRISPDYKPRFTVIIVSKRINAKFFAMQSVSNLENPPPGTVVDHTVNRRYLYDFFLVSQNARQGTVNPTHYNLLYDNSSLNPDYAQQFTYKMCHLYYNWMGTIRVPAVCQYAHRAAQMVGMHLHQEHDPSLSNRLYYL